MPVSREEQYEAYYESMAALFRKLRQGHIWPLPELADELDWSVEKTSEYLTYISNNLDGDLIRQGILGEEHDDSDVYGLKRNKYVQLGRDAENCHATFSQDYSCALTPTLYSIAKKGRIPNCPTHEAAEHAVPLLEEGILASVEMGDFVSFLAAKLENRARPPDHELIVEALHDAGIDDVTVEDLP